ncbi:uncharacterized protein LTR77_005555 [Saxophila tyrrhenica]|uniref:BTB domain-containing protein n=1 Tax=Saxophila tyrrhenica TaxID=1690608 RepID=A0AAV9P9L3_9PEZI|nr:hypothetical protein LTR77_005555 [Saxophila tyrrhenica]
MDNPKIVQLITDGDVMLVCGGEDEEFVYLVVVFSLEITDQSDRTKLQVRSSVLTVSSKVFKALLSPQFKEGAELAGAGSVEIALPEDDPEAMAIMCKVLHLWGRNDIEPRSLTTEQLLNVAVPPDKYGCTRAMRRAAEQWIKQLEKVVDHTKLHSLIAACFYFDHEPMWRLVSRAFVFESTEARDLQPLDEFQYPQELDDLCAENYRAQGHANGSGDLPGQDDLCKLS